KEAKLLFEDTTEIVLENESVKSTGSFKLLKDNSYKIIIEDIAGNKNPSPITYNLKTLYDDYSTIELIAPEDNVSLGNYNRLPVILNIADDYSITKMIPHHRLSQKRYEQPQEEYSQLEIPLTPGAKELNVE